MNRRRRRLARTRRAQQQRPHAVALPLVQLDARWLMAFVLALLLALRLMG